MSMNKLASFQPPSLCTLFRGVALKARRELAGEESAQTLENVRTISDHIVARLPEMQRHNIVHLAQSLDLLPAHVQATSAAKLSEGTMLAVQHVQDNFVELTGSTSVADPQDSQ